MTKTKLPRFISFDGADGAGKTTQMNVFADLIRAKGFNVRVTKALGGDGTDFVQNELRKLLLSPTFPSDDSESEEKLFAIADGRNLRASEDFLNQSPENVVVCDRGIASHIVYALAKDIDPEDLGNWHADLYNAYDDLAQQYGGLNIILVPEDEKMAMDRVAARGAPTTPRLENLDMQKRVIEGMRAVDDDTTLQGQFMPFTFTTVTVEVYRNESVQDVTAKIKEVLVNLGYTL